MILSAVIVWIGWVIFSPGQPIAIATTSFDGCRQAIVTATQGGGQIIAPCEQGLITELVLPVSADPGASRDIFSPRRD